MASQSERTATTRKAILKSARALLMASAYDRVSVDEIAAGAGVAKGAVYHHFKSKEMVFEAVLDAVQADLAKQLQVRLAANAGPRTPETIARNVRLYLLTASRDGLRQIILADGPVVLGWKRWREIDDRYFLEAIRSGIEAIMPQATDRADVDAATQLIGGAIAEAALICGAAPDPEATATGLCLSLQKMLQGLQGTGRA
ncbi:MAG: TetR/AcrR family transcriptional regulator [Rhodospirillales bacterium]|nr:TetR/AcrR family transcriptional regulator [Rhodospirillales bacterium]